MFRQIGWGAAAVLAAGVLAVGCSDSDSDAVQAALSLFPGNAPASPVDENFVSNDGFAFTNANSVVAGIANTDDLTPRMYWNRANGSGILMWGAQNRNNFDSHMLMASYYDGQKFNTPVEIVGDDGAAVQDPTQRIQGFKVLWINTSQNQDQVARAKDGDAVILFTRNDIDLTQNVAASQEDDNIRLWFSYFNVSEASADASGGFKHGFLTPAITLDPDIQRTGSDDSDVGVFGFVSNALSGTHEFSDESDLVDSGEPTDYVYAAWFQETDSSGGASAPRMRFIELDLTDPALPTPSATDLVLGQGTFDANEGASGNNFIVHNNAMFWDSFGVSGGSGNDTVTTVTLFTEDAPGGVASAQTLNEAATANFDEASMPNPSDVYGPDHGLDKFYIFHLADGFGDGATGRATDQDVMLVTISTDSATAPTIERAEIDPHTAVIGGNVTAGSGQMDEILTAISRPGTHITVLMDGNHTNDNTIFGNDVVHVRGVQTQLAGAAANRLLADALTAVVQAPALLGTGAQNQGDVFGTEFQQDLAQGWTAIQAREGQQRGVGPSHERLCNFQGNTNRMNFIYQQSNNLAAATTADEIRLLVNGFTVDLDTDVTVPPTGAIVSGTEVVAETVDTFWTGQVEAIAFDAGDDTVTGQPAAPTTTAGRVIVFFVSQDNNKLDEAVAGSFFESRLYAWEAGTVVTVSTNPTVASNDLYQVGQTQGGQLPGLLGGIAVPTNDSANSTTSVGDTLHIYWTENLSGPGNGGGGNDTFQLGSRSYNLADTAATTAVALADRFTPPTTDDPIFIDNPTGGGLLSNNYANNNTIVTSQVYFLRDGNTAGIVFDEDERIWYQQTSDDAEGYYEDQGVSAPEIVDHDAPLRIQRLWLVRPTPFCDNLSGAVVFWEKAVMQANNFGGPDQRGQVRIFD